MDQDVAREVKRVIRTQLNVAEDRVKLKALFIEDLGADSLGLMGLTLAFEEAFEIDIPSDDAEWIHTVQDAVDYIGKRVSHPAYCEHAQYSQQAP